MNAYYTLNNGCRLETFLWNDILKDDTFRETIEVTPIYGKKRGRTCKKKMFKDKRGVYIIWNKNKVYLNEYDFLTAEKLIAKIEKGKALNDRWYVSDDEILATFLKETNKIGIVIDMPAYDMVCPQLGIGFVGNKEYSVLCIPTEKQYSKPDWAYKFTLECECEDLRRYIPSRHFYFSDFCSFVKQGLADIVLKEEFKKDIEQKHAKQIEEENRLRNKVAKLFGKKVQKERLTLIHL